MGYSFPNMKPFPPSLTGLWGVSSAMLLLNWNDHRWPIALLQMKLCFPLAASPEPKHPSSRVGSAAPLLYSRGKCTDVFVATEGQTDCGKGSALVEHLCHLRGQIACRGHQHFSKVTCPGCRLFLRSASQKRKVTHLAYTSERKVCKHLKTFYFKRY